MTGQTNFRVSVALVLACFAPGCRTLHHGAPARVRETGQVTCSDEAGAVIPCANSGQDGDLRPGVRWPVPRFVDNLDGTVTDRVTGLAWLKNAACLGRTSWWEALMVAKSLASGACGLTDGSVAGDWRLPTRFELESLLDLEFYRPALANGAGTGHWAEGDPFTFSSSSSGSDTYQFFFWQSGTCLSWTYTAWCVDISNGLVWREKKDQRRGVWPVRDGHVRAAARVGATGQQRCWARNGGFMPCAGSGQEGESRAGAQWPVPRFLDNRDGTVADRLTGLVWLKNANCFGSRTWGDALEAARSLASGACGLSDGSTAGDWRLPSRFELESLLDLAYIDPALPNAAGTGQWAEGDAFTGVVQGSYWQSSTWLYPSEDTTSPATHAFGVGITLGGVNVCEKTEHLPLWPVRGGLR